jgi:hypothetical protein
MEDSIMTININAEGLWRGTKIAAVVAGKVTAKVATTVAPPAWKAVSTLAVGIKDEAVAGYETGKVALDEAKKAQP